MARGRWRESCAGGQKRAEPVRAKSQGKLRKLSFLGCDMWRGAVPLSPGSDGVFSSSPALSYSRSAGTPWISVFSQVDTLNFWDPRSEGFREASSTGDTAPHPRLLSEDMVPVF